MNRVRRGSGGTMKELVLAPLVLAHEEDVGNHAMELVEEPRREPEIVE